MKTIEQISQRIGDLPNNGAVYIDAGGRGQITAGLTTGDLKAVLERLEDLEQFVRSIDGFSRRDSNIYGDRDILYDQFDIRALADGIYTSIATGKDALDAWEVWKEKNR